MELLEIVTNLAVLTVVVIAAWVIRQARREQRFLESLKPLLPQNEYLPLFDALLSRAREVYLLGVYLVLLTAVGALLAAYDKPSLAQAFPPIRAINAALFLVLLSGPLVLGRAMRRLPPRD
jgi:hypothetical protein